MSHEITVKVRPMAADSPGFIVIWQVPSSASQSVDFEVTDSAGEPVRRPDVETWTDIERVVQMLALPGPHEHWRGPGGRPVPAVQYARLERLATESWRCIRSPERIAETELRVSWSEAGPRRASWLGELLSLARGVYVPLATGGFASGSDVLLEIDAGSNAEVKKLELSAPLHAHPTALPLFMTESSAVARIGLELRSRFWMIVGVVCSGVLAALLGGQGLVSSTYLDWSRLEGLLWTLPVPLVTTVLLESFRRKSGVRVPAPFSRFGSRSPLQYPFSLELHRWPLFTPTSFAGRQESPRFSAACYSLPWAPTFRSRRSQAVRCEGDAVGSLSPCVATVRSVTAEASTGTSTGRVEIG